MPVDNMKTRSWYQGSGDDWLTRTSDFNMVPGNIFVTAGEIVRRVPTSNDYIAFKGRRWKVPGAFRGETLAIRPLERDGAYGVFFAANRVATIDLTDPKTVGHVSGLNTCAGHLGL